MRQQPVANDPIYRVAGFVRPPKRESIRRPIGILEEIAYGIFAEFTGPLTHLTCRSTLSYMGYEVEVKYRSVDHAELGRRLTKFGAHRGPEISQEDIYLSHPSRDFASTHEALRIRRIGAENRITYKGPRLSGPTKTREEIEIAFASGEAAFDQLARLFELLGFRAVAAVRKSRTPFHLSWHGHDIEIVVDRVADLGDFAEIETLVESASELPAAQEAVLTLAGEFGLTEVEPRSYLRMLLESPKCPS
jgi:adenylate cyclase, class 2